MWLGAENGVLASVCADDSPQLAIVIHLTQASSATETRGRSVKRSRLVAGSRTRRRKPCARPVGVRNMVITLKWLTSAVATAEPEGQPLASRCLKAPKGENGGNRDSHLATMLYSLTGFQMSDAD